MLILGTAAALVWSLISWKRQPPEVPFTKVVRETIVSSVSTNGKVEPLDWATARAERSGPVIAILTDRGTQVEQGAALVEIDSTDAQAELAAADARVEQAKADLATFARGGRSQELADITSGIAKAKQDLNAAQKDFDGLSRLEAKGAATKIEVEAAKRRVDAAQLQIESLEQKRKALVVPSDQEAASARLHDAEAAAKLASDRIKQSVVRAPISGTVYQFDLKKGAYLKPGDFVADIGKLDRVKVNVYVDEPDLGRIARGQPVTISWDALPGREWKGEVDRTPTEIQALGTRQVGEVTCVINNPDHDLLPNTNVTAEIRSETVANALTIPREAIRRPLGQAGVFVLSGDRVEWRKIAMGIGSTTRIQVEGLKEGDSIAMPTEKPLKEGMVVRPVYQ